MNLIEEMERENWSSEYDKEVVKLTSAFPDLKSLKDEDYCYINHFALKHTNEGDYILDVGCGIGLLCNLLKKYNRKPVGIDVSTLAVETAKNNVEGVAFNQMYCEQLDYQGGLFDCVTCTEVIEHLKEPGVAIGEMLRVLKPRGKLIITTPNRTFNNYYRFDPEDDGFRHSDHNFEMTQEQFKEYILSIIKLLPYDASFFGIGDRIDADYTTQGVVLTRKDPGSS